VEINKRYLLVGLIILSVIGGILFSYVSKNRELGGIEFVILQKVQTYLERTYDASNQDVPDEMEIRRNLDSLRALDAVVRSSDELWVLYKRIDMIFDGKYRLDILDKEKLNQINVLQADLMTCYHHIKDRSKKFPYVRYEYYDQNLAAYYYIRSQRFQELMSTN